MRGRVYQHVVAEVRAGGRVPKGRLDARRGPVLLEAPPRAPHKGHLRVVAKVLPHAGRVLDDPHPVPFQVLRRAHARQHQKLGRAYRAASSHHLTGVVDGSPVLGRYLHPDGAPALEQYPPRLRASGDRQVGPLAGHAQVSQRGAPPHAVHVVQGRGADPGRVGVVVVRALREPVVEAGLVEGLLVLVHLRLGKPAHRYRPVRSVEVAAEAAVALEAAEVGQQLPVVPLVVAHSGPAVVVLGHAAQQYLGVHGTRPAGNLPSGYQPRLGIVRKPSHVGAPVLADKAPGERSAGAVAVLHFVGQRGRVRVVAPRLQQQHRAVRVLCQPRRQDRPCRASPDDYRVVRGHAFPPVGRIMADLSGSATAGLDSLP